MHTAIIETRRIVLAADTSGTDNPLQGDAAAETPLTVSDIEVLTLSFLFGDSAGVKATGASNPARRATLGLAKACLNAFETGCGRPAGWILRSAPRRRPGQV